MDDPPDYWFAAKRYGWGWGLPLRWQGWLVLALYLGLMLLVTFVIPPHREPALFIACVAALTALLVAICWIKGPPPRWRWG